MIKDVFTVRMGFDIESAGGHQSVVPYQSDETGRPTGLSYSAGALVKSQQVLMAHERGGLGLYIQQFVPAPCVQLLRRIQHLNDIIARLVIHGHLFYLPICAT